MNDDLNNLLTDLTFTIQELDLSEEAKAEHLNLIQAVMSNPTSANIQALVIVLEATSKMDNMAIQNTIDELKSVTQL